MTLLLDIDNFPLDTKHTLPHLSRPDSRARRLRQPADVPLTNTLRGIDGRCIHTLNHPLTHGINNTLPRLFSIEKRILRPSRAGREAHDEHRWIVVDDLEVGEGREILGTIFADGG